MQKFVAASIAGSSMFVVVLSGELSRYSLEHSKHLTHGFIARAFSAWVPGL